MLFRLEAEARKRGWTTLFFNLAQVTKQEASGRSLLDRLLESSSCRRTIEAAQIHIADLESREPAEGFSELVLRLLQPLSARRPPRVLLLWDEAERLIDVESNDTGFLERLRATLENFEDLSFVVAATQLLSDLFGREGHCSPFLTAFRWRSLGPLEPEEGRALLLARQTGGWASEPGPEIVDEMVRWCGGHPYVLQEAGFRLEERQRRGLGWFNLTEWQGAILGNQNLKDAFRDDFAKLTITQQEILSKLCKDPTLSLEDLCSTTDRPEEQIKEACDFLSNYGYIRTSEGKYELRFGFYSRMVVNTVSTANPQKVSRISRRTVFICYAREDLTWLVRLRRFLEPGIRSGEIDDWSDQKIRPGALWREEIARALRDARVAVLLLSQDFLASQFIREVELPSILARAKAGTCRVLCLHVRASSLSGEVPQSATQLLLLKEFQAINNAEQPLSGLSETAADTALIRAATEIAQGDRAL
jgi:hypothetical protein